MALGITAKKKLPVKMPVDRMLRALQESPGGMGADAVRTEFTAVGSSGSVNIGGWTAQPGIMGHVRSITIACNKQFEYLIVAGSSMLFNNGNRTWRGFTPTGGGTVTADIDIVVHEKYALNVYAVTPHTATVTPTDKLVTLVTFNSDMYTQELNVNGSEPLVTIGDSVTRGNAITSGATHTGKDSWAVQMRDHLQAKGHDIRLVNWGSPGIASWQIRAAMESGRYDVDNAKFITYMAGINDIAGGWTQPIQDSYESNVNYAIAWKQRRFPDAKMIFFGPTPQGDSKEASVQHFRDFLNTRVGQVRAGGDSSIFYCNLGTAFDRTNTGFYSDSVTHPNIAGNLAIATVINSFIDANGI